MFTEGPGNNTRDPMVIRVGKLYHAYYTAYPNQQGADYVRTSKDLKTWSASKKVAFGGAAGTGPYSAECPFVYYHKASGYYYLFRTQRYGANAQSSIYRSKDPMNFGDRTTTASCWARCRWPRRRSWSMRGSFTSPR